MPVSVRRERDRSLTHGGLDRLDVLFAIAGPAPHV